MPTDQDALQFANALKTIESTRDPSAIVTLFAADASLESIAMQKPIHGIDAIAEFWREYITFFSKLETTFTSIIASESIAVLEWCSKGVLAGGGEIDYRGVSLLQYRNGKVVSFRAYYDSAAFVPEFEKHLKR